MTADMKPLSEQPIPPEFMERAAALRSAVIWQSNAANEIIARALMAEHDAALDAQAALLSEAKEVLGDAAQRLRYDGDLFHDQSLESRQDASWEASDRCYALLLKLTEATKT